ncbi:MAG TPA: TadE/TadG family type IV pilus assembly protein [Planctomycetia bacterium]|nr:TadE/TadG family type IV pilus assembly protein [Planctomycetia bacterium]
MRLRFVKPVLRSPLRSARKGAATLEFAVVAPVLILLIMGMLEIGRAIMVVNFVNSAARDGARRAALTNASAADVISTTRQSLSRSSINSTNLTITVVSDVNEDGTTEDVSDLSSIPTGRPVGVRVNVPFQDIGWLGRSLFIPANRNLTDVSLMRRER